MSQTADTNLPHIDTPLSTEQIRDRLLALSKQGKLPGYTAQEPQGIASVAAHGAPFDSKLVLRHEGGSLTFACRLLPTMPAVFALLLVITVWPGLPLTDGFLSSFEWYASLMAKIGIDTWHWYLPLTILPAPFAYLGAVKKSRTSARQSAVETIERLRPVLTRTS